MYSLVFLLLSLSYLFIFLIPRTSPLSPLPPAPLLSHVSFIFFLLVIVFSFFTSSCTSYSSFSLSFSHSIHSCYSFPSFLRFFLPLIPFHFFIFFFFFSFLFSNRLLLSLLSFLFFFSTSSFFTYQNTSPISILPQLLSSPFLNLLLHLSPPSTHTSLQSTSKHIPCPLLHLQQTRHESQYTSYPKNSPPPFSLRSPAEGCVIALDNNNNKNS